MPPRPCASANCRSSAAVEVSPIDNAVSPAVAAALREAAHDAVHVREYELQAAADQEIFDRAADEQRIVVSADTDFGTLLANRRTRFSSVVLFRHGAQARPGPQAALLLANLGRIEADLLAGTIVVIEPGRIRTRSLPL